RQRLGVGGAERGDQCRQTAISDFKHHSAWRRRPCAGAEPDAAAGRCAGCGHARRRIPLLPEATAAAAWGGGGGMMHARVLYQMVRADFLERVRRTSFLLALGFSLFLAYAVYTGEVALQLDDYRGVANSAWLGSVIGLVASVWVSLIGFYVVKNAVERDRQTRVGQVLASTPLSRPFYTLGKALSNFVVLGAMVLVLVLAAVVIQVFGGGSRGL